MIQTLKLTGSYPISSVAAAAEVVVATVVNMEREMWSKCGQWWPRADRDAAYCSTAERKWVNVKVEANSVGFPLENWPDMNAVK